MAETTNIDLIERAKSLTPRLRERARETELLRRPHDDSIKDLIDSGLLQLLTPKRYGGHESDLHTLSKGCTSTAWIAAFYMGHNAFVAKFPEAAQKEIFADRPFGLIPTANAPTMKARRVDGGWELSGRAPWGSGVMHADWCMFSGMVEGEGPRSFLVPAGQVSVDDTWHYSGMSGTGSNDMIVEGVFVPEHRTIDGVALFNGPTEGSSIHANKLYSAPLVVFALCEIVGIMTGGLRGALEAFEENVKSRVRAFSGSVVKDQQLSHVTLGDLRISADMGSELALSYASRLTGLIQGPGVTIADRIRLRGHAAFIAQHCRETINEMMSKSGASGFHIDSPIQRAFRDLNMLSNHAFWDWDASRELVGRDFLGLEPNNPLI